MGSHSVYLPPGRGDIPTFTPAEAGTRFSDPGGMQGRDLTLLRESGPTRDRTRDLQIASPVPYHYTNAQPVYLPVLGIESPGG